MLQSTDSTNAIYAYLAPLSNTFIRYSFSHYRRDQTEQFSSREVFSSEEAATLAREQFNLTWTNYLTEFRSTRQQIVEEMDALVLLDKYRPTRKKDLGPTWFRQQISRYGPAHYGKHHLISTDAIDNYCKANIVQKQGWGDYDPRTMAVVLMCRQLDHTRVRNWLPSAIPDGEESYWVWTQEKPNAPLVPCPYPDLPAALPPTALVFTRWAGASWDNVGWIRIGNLGAISFAGLLQAYQRMPFISTLEELPITLTTPQLDTIWNRTQKAVEAVSLASESRQNEVPKELLDMSIGLADALTILARYKSTGTLRATVRRLPERRSEIACSIELLNGNVVACRKIQQSQSMPIKLAELLKVDEKQPSAWTFQAHAPEARYTSSGEYSARQPESQLEIQASIVKTLRRLAVPIFSASNLKNI